MQNKILFDWLSFTVKITRVDVNGILLERFDYHDIIRLLGLEKCPFQELPGIRGFKKRFYFNSISIHCESDVHDYMWVEMSGQGCRAFESLSNHKSYSHLFNFFLNNPDIANITRLDVAYDDFKGLLDIYAIAQDTIPDVRNTNKYNYVSPMRSHEVTVSDKGICVIIGSKRSEIMFRFYDKAAERNKSDVIPHWVRCEIQLRRGRAFEFIRLLEQENETVDNLYFLVLNNYLRFVKPDETDSNKSRWDLADHWVLFATSVTSDSKSLFVQPGLDYNLAKLDHVVENQFGGGVFTYYKIHGIQRLIDTLVKKFTTAKLNPKYQRLLDEEQIRIEYAEEHLSEVDFLNDDYEKENIEISAKSWIEYHNNLKSKAWLEAHEGL